jgi:hypothetical protein
VRGSLLERVNAADLLWGLTEQFFKPGGAQVCGNRKNAYCDQNDDYQKSR